MKRWLIVFVLGLSVGLPWAAHAVANNVAAFGAKCPKDDLAGFSTGKTVIVDGKKYEVYKCPQGHEFLAPAF